MTRGKMGSLALIGDDLQLLGLVLFKEVGHAGLLILGLEQEPNSFSSVTMASSMGCSRPVLMAALVARTAMGALAAILTGQLHGGGHQLLG